VPGGHGYPVRPVSRMIFITGGTGLIGRRLVASLLQRGDRLRVLTRRVSDDKLPKHPSLEAVVGDPTMPGPWQEKVEGCDAVVHLAGAGIADRRWNRRVVQQIIDSRIDGTHQVVEAIRSAKRCPAVFISGSAIGWYGRTNGAVDESSSQGPADQLTELCLNWEAQAMEAQSLGVRTVLIRTGLVLDARGGVLSQMLPPFRMFVGGPLGSGRQMMSWVHWSDQIGLIEFAMDTPAVRGPLNATAPGAVSNREFSRTLGRVLKRPSLLPVPGFALRIVMGEFARYATMNQHVVPLRALESGYRFRQPDLEAALRELLSDESDPSAAGTVSARNTAGDSAPQGSSGAGQVDPATRSYPPAPATPASMPQRPIRLVVIGIEGALLRADGRLSEGEALACRAAIDLGCKVVLAGARPPRSIASLAGAMQVAAPLIAYNGALIWDPSAEKESRAIHHEPLDTDTARDVIAAARSAAPGVRVGIERLDRWFTDREEDGPNGSMRADEVGPLDHFLDAPVSQLCLLGTAAEIALVRQAIEPTLWKDRRIARFLVGSTLLLVAHPAVDRGIALQRLARRLGVAREQVMVIAGSADDMGMLEWAGFPVAVETAPERVRSLARELVPGADDHGAARALHRFVIAPGRIESAAQGDRS